jgi:hypothetical protein
LPLPFLFSRPIDEPQVSQMRVQRDGPRPARLRGPASRVCGCTRRIQTVVATLGGWRLR